MRTCAFGIVVMLCCFVCGCARPPSTEVQELRHLPLDSMEGIITRSGVEIDKGVSSDGQGALRIAAAEPATVRLFELNGIEVDDATLIYRARIRTEAVTGQVYLEMWCSFPGRGEFFSRALDKPLTGTTEWTTQETPFFLQRGDKPSTIKLNLVIQGKGTVWIDDAHLLKGPLQ